MNPPHDVGVLLSRFVSLSTREDVMDVNNMFLSSHVRFIGLVQDQNAGFFQLRDDKFELEMS